MAVRSHLPGQTPTGKGNQMHSSDDPPHPPPADHRHALLIDVVARVQKRAEQWRDALTVSIGRARELTDLEETRIRYFEDLGVLQPSKSSHGAGSNRLYTLADLRCLYALTLLTKEYDLRPAEAAALVRDYRQQIEYGQARSLGELVEREASVVADGFLLARLLSQLIDAAQNELVTTRDDVDNAPGSAKSATGFRVSGIVMLMRQAAPETHGLSAANLQQLGRALCQRPRDALIALDRSAFFPTDQQETRAAPQPSLRDDSTILFYSRDEAYELPLRDDHRFCLYLTSYEPKRSSWLILEPCAVEEPPPQLEPGLARRALLDRVVELCARIFPSFADSELTKNYRYRSDGFQIEHSRATYRALLQEIVNIIFADPSRCVAALLIPNNLERPAALTMLAAYNYDDALVPRVKLDLTGEGQGLCGRAYNLHEPFFSSDAGRDPRVAYAHEEHSQVALAIPLLMNGFSAPLGVLYLASQRSRDALQSDDAYFGLILANILSEQLGRWWLTRLRKHYDATLHRQMESTVRWLDSLGPHGRYFQDALDKLQELWRAIKQDDTDADATSVALLLFDIDSYRQNVQARSTSPVPLEAQNHVHQAILKILQETQDYWFKNDHALVILPNTKPDEALAMARRIANQVRAVPTRLLDKAGKYVTITVSIAIKSMTYRDLLDLDNQDGERFRLQMQAVLDDLREQTAKSPPHTIQLFGKDGWSPL